MVLMKTQKVFLSFISIFLIFFAKAFAFEDLVEKRYNFWPLGVYSKNKIRGYERKEFLGPFIYKYHFESENGTPIVPFTPQLNNLTPKKPIFYPLLASIAQIMRLPPLSLYLL